MIEQMTSNKPYLVRAFYDWISDNQLTPYIAVDATVYGVIVPLNYVKDDQIVLNVAGSAVGAISMGAETIEFSARFGGKLEHLVVPYGAIAAIYAKENGAGTGFTVEHTEQPNDTEDSSEVGLAAVDKVDVESSEEELADAPQSKDKPKGRPTLTVVK